MKNRTFYRTLMVSILSAVSVRMSAVIDFVSVDPLWEAAVLTGSKAVMEQYNTQNTKLLEISALQNTMALHFNAIKEWRRKENSYLKVACYAEAVQAGTKLTTEAIRTVRDLMDLKKVMQRNPEGIATTLAMNNLYMETITEFIKTFRMLNNVLIGEDPEDENVTATPVQSIPYEAGCVQATVTIRNSTNKDIAFDGKISFILHGYIASEDYTGHKSFHGICTGGDYTIPAGGSRTYTVIFTKDDTPRDGIGLPFAGSGHTGSRTANNAYYIGNKGFTCENISESVTFQEGGSYTMVIPSNTDMWYSRSGSDGSGGMLTGKERVEMIWSLCDRLDELNTKVRKLILSVAYYRVKDIWAFYTRGMFDRHKSDIAENCLERWNRVQDAIRIMN